MGVRSMLSAAFTLACAKAAQAAPEYDYPSVASQVLRQPVNYTDSSNTSLTGWLAYKTVSDAARPGVIILPDWDGISNYERWRADLFAEQGYVGFVADIYGDSVAQGARMPVPERQNLTRFYNSHVPLLRARLQAALATVRSLKQVQKDKIAVVGYCFGGGAALELFRLWPQAEGVVGVATFHGSPLVRDGSQTQPGNPIRVQAHNGFNDTSIPRANISALEAELSIANATWSFTDYANTAHAFTLLEAGTWDGTGKLSGTHYNPVADRESWWALRGFLLDVFGLVNASNPYVASQAHTDAQTGISGVEMAAQ